jgi:hypothetical protein
MGLPVGEVIGLLVGGIVIVALGQTLAKKSENTVRDESVNNENNISYGGRSRKSRKSRR